MLWFESIVALLWLATGASLATRTYFVFNYAAYANLPPSLEVVGAPLGVIPILLLALGCIALSGKYRESPASTGKTLWGIEANLCLLASTLPFWISWMRPGAQGAGGQVVEVGFWEPVFYALMTGIAAYWSKSSGIRLPAIKFTKVQQDRFAISVVVCASFVCFLCWFRQTLSLFDTFQLGFNDFGHFLLRVIHTARGQGFLMEAPFLPTFWDHFNPGLVLLVPMWQCCPRVELFFALQSLALAVCGLLLFLIAKNRGSDSPVAMVWGLTWLAYPSVGQMNVAYTYGWHPITFSIPTLLAAYLFLQRRKFVIAICFALLACSFEEGAIAAIGCFAMASALRGWYATGISSETDSGGQAGGSARAWIIVWVIAIVCFVLVYRLSGLAEFQTGRFAKLGDSALEIAMSPMVKPMVFFELLFRGRNLAFLALLFAPFAVQIATRRFLWAALGVAPLFLVLLLWEHMPAQSLAFQYASVILPLLFIGAIESSQREDSMHKALSVLVISWVLSVYVGQLPWSSDTLKDVKSRSYPPGSLWTREAGASDHREFHNQIQTIREHGLSDTLALDRCRLLATGRLAGHFLGAWELETVGQFAQRAGDYAKQHADLASPLLAYDLILLDPIEAFQQTKEQTMEVYQRALELGFEDQTKSDGFLILRNPKHAKD